MYLPLVKCGQSNEDVSSVHDLDNVDDISELLLLLAGGTLKKNTHKKEKEETEKIQRNTSKEVAEKSNSSAVHSALVSLIGENPSEEEKLTLEQLDAVLQLDELLRELEKNESEKSQKKSSPTFDSDLSEVLLNVADAKLEDMDDELKNEDAYMNKESQDKSAIKEALSTLLGEEPSEEQKLTVEEIEAIIKLDALLQEDEKNTNVSVTKINDLVETAVNFVEGAVNLREDAEKRLIGDRVFDDYDYYTYEDLLDYLNVSPSELRELIKNGKE